MGSEDGRGGRGSASDAFDGRDLLVGRPQGAEGRPGAGTDQSPTAATSSQAGAHDEGTREILQTVRAMAAKIDALLSAIGPESETAQALKREIATLMQSVEDTRGSLAGTAKLAARREAKASSEARVLTEGVAALKKENTALGTRIGEAHQLAHKVIAQMHTAILEGQAVYDSKIDLQETAKGMDNTLRAHAESLGVHAENMLRINRNHRLRPLRTGLAIGVASFVFFVLGAVLQVEVDVLSLGDRYHEWNDHVLEHYAPTLADCAMRATSAEKAGTCRIDIEPVPEITIPYSYPELRLP